MTLYKFRSLQNLRRFLDILVKKRLYMAHYNEMNDPMEGAFLLDESKKHLLKDIWSGKYKKLICCFSADYHHTLLWSHYADSHRGCCLEVKVTSKLAPYEVCYSQRIPKTDKCNINKILTHKSDYWKYENEVRFFKDESTPKGKKSHPYLSIKIKKVLLGCKMSRTDVNFYTALIQSILGDKIEVKQIKKEELDTGLT